MWFHFKQYFLNENTFVLYLLKIIFNVIIFSNNIINYARYTVVMISNQYNMVATGFSQRIETNPWHKSSLLGKGCVFLCFLAIKWIV